ncbi:MAG: hypothetical protein WA690_18615 [Candidatus Acidiferrales bacterium]|jgi:hypothetical protein
MAIIKCEEFLGHLEPWMDGERSSDAQAHLRNCPRCLAIVNDLNAIQAEARTWSAFETDAPERVWVSLRAQLEQEGLIREAVPVSTSRDHAQPSADSGWLHGLFGGFPRPVLAGAYLAVLIAVAFALSGPINKKVNEAKWLEGTRIATSPLRAELNTAEQNSISSLPDSDVSASLHRNLAIVDNYIALCEKSVHEEPQNELARDYLYEAYRQKADLLAQMSERGENIQ